MLKRLPSIFLVGLAVLAANWGYRHYPALNALERKLLLIVSAQPEQMVDCALFKKRRPLVLLALGQSNAGNHGAYSISDDAPIAMMSGADCVLAEDPLPGATGKGGSIWRHLPALLSQELDGREILLSVLAVDATTIDDWTSPGNMLAARLIDQIQSLQLRGLKPDYVLWQQGEADAQMSTTATEYRLGLDRLAALLNKAGTNAPVLLARSTVCRSGPSPWIRSAVEQAVADNPRFISGPDTDSLVGEAFRTDGCHLNEKGLRFAAKAWATAIKQIVSVGVP